ncbi:MAG: enoyl-ACP reductase [Micrococcales bacterium]|nr:enoyl-ACP reductase [Micrococcales bacterium]
MSVGAVSRISRIVKNANKSQPSKSLEHIHQEKWNCASVCIRGSAGYGRRVTEGGSSNKRPSQGSQTQRQRKRSGTKTKARPNLDLVLFGATGFTGGLVADYLSRQAPPRTRIGIAGRNAEKLANVRDRLSGAANDWTLITADSDDPEALQQMAVNTKALISTVGPYTKYGLPVVAACAAAGTNYGDLTGEVVFMRRSIDQYDDLAKRSGARIVHSCGFDSIPSDLGVLALHLQAKAQDGHGHLAETHFLVRKIRGGISGGTIASGLNELDIASQDKALSKVLADPYSLSPDRSAEPSPGDPRDKPRAYYDEELDTWVGPFFMAPINTRVVRRSNAISGYSYGHGFRYDEGTAFGSGLAGRARATGMLGGFAVMGGVMQNASGRRFVSRFLPSPGAGPSERTRQNGMFLITLHTRTPEGERYRATVAADGDPGYAATSVMLGQAGLTLAGDQRRLPRAAGVLTPATGMGLRLIENLKAAGMSIDARKDT